jgi:CRISPR/Cas system-associated exonuclease Cas4 (RecB family)
MLRELIDKFYIERQKDREQSRFYITDAGKCPRAIFFKFKNVPRKDMQANILRMFHHGDYIHQLIMSALLGARDIHVVASEINIPPQEIISGRADAILSDGKEMFVLDIKSMNSMLFRNLAEPKDENVNQIQLYLHYFKIPKGILLYVNKDTQELKEFVVEYSKDHADSLIKNLDKLKSQIDENLVPSRLPSYSADWQCRYCQFKDICKKGEDGQMQWDSLKEKIEAKKQEV